MDKNKTIYDLKLHETLVIEEDIKIGEVEGVKKYEVTRVPGGWIYSFEYPGWRQQENTFVPFKVGEWGEIKKVTNEK